MPAVSVVIPVYNVDKYLSCCLNSVINQTMTDIEIILVNDGSTDNSEEICKEYEKKDSRVVYIKQENKGVSVARNIGKKYSKGEYIIFIDSDDEMNLSMIQKLYCDIKENNADIAICGIQRVKEKSDIKEDISYHNIVNRMQGKDALKVDFRYQNDHLSQNYGFFLTG